MKNAPIIKQAETIDGGERNPTLDAAAAAAAVAGGSLDLPPVSVDVVGVLLVEQRHEDAHEIGREHSRLGAAAPVQPIGVDAPHQFDPIAHLCPTNAAIKFHKQPINKSIIRGSTNSQSSVRLFAIL